MTTPRTSQGPRPAPTSWARVRLVQGESGAALWDITSDVGDTRLIVGAASTCDWQVTAIGVAAQHVELAWDGTQLWIGPAAGASDVRIDSEKLVDWTAINGRIRLEFGRAAMLIEAARGAPSLGVPPPPPAAQSWDRPSDKTAELTDNLDDMIVQEPPAASFHDESTRMLGANEPGHAAGFADESTRMLGSTGAGFGDESTRMLAPTAAEREQIAASFESEATRAPTGQYVAHVEAKAPLARVPARPAPRASVHEPAAPEGDGVFAAPPPTEEDPAMRALHQLTQQMRAVQSERFSLPARTWALISAVVVVSAYVLIRFGPSSAKPIPQAPPQIAMAHHAPMEAPKPIVHKTSIPPEIVADPAFTKNAANFLFLGRGAEALPFYEALAERFPTNEVFPAIAHVLRRKVAAQCHNGLLPSGAPCPE